MKNYFVGLFAIAAFLSCGKDDECTVDEFVGTWVGTSTCTGGIVDKDTITIAALGEDLVVNGLLVAGTTVERDDCSFEGGLSLVGVGNEVEGSLSSDGKTLTIVSSTGISLAKVTCTYVLTK